MPPEPVIGSRLRTLSLKPDHHKGHAQQLGHQTARAGVHEVVPEQVRVGVPERRRLRFEQRAQLALVHLGEHLEVGAPPDGEELLLRQHADARELELERVQLCEVHVHGDDLLGALAQVIEHVAPGGGDGEHDVVLLHVHHRVVDGGVLPGDVVDDLLAPDRGHDEVLRVHVVHHHAEAVEEVRPHQHVQSRHRVGRRAPLRQHRRHRAVRHVRVRANLRHQHGGHDGELGAETQALARVRAHQVPAHPPLEHLDVPQEQREAGDEHEVREGARLVDEHGVEHDARQEIQHAEQQRRPLFVLHAVEGEQDDRQFFYQRHGEQRGHVVV
jgi:hypothetical protein